MGLRRDFNFLKACICLPCSGEKACSFAHKEVFFYEVDFLCGLRFPVHPFVMQLLHTFQITPGQLTPNAQRMIISCMLIQVSTCEGDIIMLNQFLYLYQPPIMSILSSYPRIESLGLFLGFHHPFVIRNHDIYIYIYIYINFWNQLGNRV